VNTRDVNEVGATGCCQMQQFRTVEHKEKKRDRAKSRSHCWEGSGGDGHWGGDGMEETITDLCALTKDC
jgi:hypothetical protein